MKIFNYRWFEKFYPSEAFVALFLISVWGTCGDSDIACGITCGITWGITCGIIWGMSAINFQSGSKTVFLKCSFIS